MNEKPFKYIAHRGTVFECERCDFQTPICVSDVPDDPLYELDLAEMIGYHATNIHPSLKGFRGYDCIKFATDPKPVEKFSTPIPKWVTPGAEAEFGKVYGAIPEWVREKFSGMTMVQMIHLGFEQLQKNGEESLIEEVQSHSKTLGFLAHLIRTHNFDVSKEYWAYMRAKDQQAKDAALPSAPKQEASA